MAPAATPARWPTWCRATSPPATPPPRGATSAACSPRTRRACPGLILLAGLDQEAGDPAAAEAGYRAAVAAAPALPQAHLALYAFLAGQGRMPEAEAALDAGLAAAPDSPALVFAQAGLLEKKGDIDGAIAAYETLYAQDSGSPVLANNLASLITSYRDDPASLDRAFAIARRLRGTDVPYFQDTYGWILHRRGDQDEALQLPRPRRQALPDNALVQFHLAETELALDQRDEARASFERAVAAAGGRKPAAAARRRQGPHRRDRRLAGRQGLAATGPAAGRSAERDQAAA